jgi:photosystem II stability/assembly factor-like uncharacterized protein
VTCHVRSLSAVVALAIAAAGCRTPVEPAPLEWLDQVSGTSATFRGASAVSDLVAWASGSGGTVVRTIDGGATWQTRTMPGLDTDELRDIEALSADVAWVMAVGRGTESRIYKTSDGGDTWTLQFTSEYPEAFFSAMAFWDEQRGIAVAGGLDPQFVVILTDDGGATWTRVEPANLPAALEGEGFWAATGTNVALLGDNHVWLATSRSRVLRSADGGRTWQVADSPIVSGANTGARSITFRDPMNGISVGGDAQNSDDAIDNLARTTDGGVTWTLVRGPDGQASALSGNRTAVSYVPGTRLVLAVGQNGADLSRDDGLTWTRVDVPILPGSDLDVPALLGLAVSPGGRVAWAMGARGRIMRISGF